MLRNASFAATLCVAVACHQGGTTSDAASQDLPRPLAGFATQRLVVTPTAHVRVDTAGWVQRQGGARAVGRLLDSAIVTTFDARGLGSRWIFPAELVRAWERNRTYAADPYALSAEPLRLPSFKTGEKYGEPLSSQLRTMIALHEDTRYVLLPVDLRLEPMPPARVRAVMRVALLDPRVAEARWVTEVSGDPGTTVASALSSMASRLADLFIAP